MVCSGGCGVSVGDTAGVKVPVAVDGAKVAVAVGCSSVLLGSGVRDGVGVGDGVGVSEGLVVGVCVRVGRAVDVAVGVNVCASPTLPSPPKKVGVGEGITDGGSVSSNADGAPNWNVPNRPLKRKAYTLARPSWAHDLA